MNQLFQQVRVIDPIALTDRVADVLVNDIDKFFFLHAEINSEGRGLQHVRSLVTETENEFIGLDAATRRNLN